MVLVSRLDGLLVTPHPGVPVLQASGQLRPQHRCLVALKSADQRNTAQGGAGCRERVSASFHSKVELTRHGVCTRSHDNWYFHSPIYFR